MASAGTFTSATACVEPSYSVETRDDIMKDGKLTEEPKGGGYGKGDQSSQDAFRDPE